MTLLRFEPINNLNIFSSRYNRMLDEFTGLPHISQESFSPKIDVYEDEKSIFIEAEIPGVAKENIKLTVHENILSIEGEKARNSKKLNENNYKGERNFGKFKRSFTIPSEVDSEDIDAIFNNGILEIKLNKVEPKVEKERIIELN